MTHSEILNRLECLMRALIELEDPCIQPLLKGDISRSDLYGYGSSAQHGTCVEVYALMLKLTKEEREKALPGDGKVNFLALAN